MDASSNRAAVIAELEAAMIGLTAAERRWLRSKLDEPDAIPDSAAIPGAATGANPLTLGATRNRAAEDWTTEPCEHCRHVKGDFYCNHCGHAGKDTGHATRNSVAERLRFLSTGLERSGSQTAAMELRAIADEMDAT